MPGNSPHRPRRSVRRDPQPRHARAHAPMPGVDPRAGRDGGSSRRGRRQCGRHGRGGLGATPRSPGGRQEPAAGVHASVNRGLAEAAGEILIALNSDTEVLPGSLAAVVARFDADARVGVAGPVSTSRTGARNGAAGPRPPGSSPWPAACRGCWRASLVAQAAAAGGHRAAAVRGLGDRRGPGHAPAGLGGWARSTRSTGSTPRTSTSACAPAPAAGRWRLSRRFASSITTARRSGGAPPRWRARTRPSSGPTWSCGAHGRSGAGAAALALRLGGRLRLFGRRLREVSLPAESRAAWRRDTLAYRQALTAVSAPLPKPTDRSVTRR